MQYPLYATVRAGRTYSKQWPAQPELNSLFIERKVILLTSITARFMPLSALCCSALQYWFLGADYLPQILAMLFFLASLPLQGWYWLGVRAATPLPPAIAAWYQQIRVKMQQQGIELASLKAPGCYRDLAQLLSKAYQQLDKTFVKEWL